MAVWLTWLVAEVGFKKKWNFQKRGFTASTTVFKVTTPTSITRFMRDVMSTRICFR